MIILISPSKTLDFSGNYKGEHTIPDFLKESTEDLFKLIFLLLS